MPDRACYVLRSEMTVESSLADTFRVFEDPNNLAKITPSWLNFRIVTPNLEMREGALIDYTIRWLAFPMRWRTLIAAYEAPRYFIDEQIRGPYTMWRHLHTFEETPDGTRVADEVRYILPMGPFGRMAHASAVGRQLRGIFRFRQQALAPLLGRIVGAPDPVIETASSTDFSGSIPRIGRGETASRESRRPAKSY
ncbi:MAG: SRPBCC family protein [Acidobacteriota bacterium]